MGYTATVEKGMICSKLLDNTKQKGWKKGEKTKRNLNKP